MTRGEVARALDLCARLDRERAACPDDDSHLLVIGELLGGLSAGGFWFDMLAHLQSVEDRVREDQPDDLRTMACVEHACEAAAREFCDAAEAVLGEQRRMAA